MSRKDNLGLFVFTIDKNNIDENSLVDILSQDNDLSENEDYYREDTLSLGFKNEAERVSKEIFDSYKDVEDESERVEKMVDELFEVDNFIGVSDHYGNYEFEITETDFCYVISVAYTHY